MAKTNQNLVGQPLPADELGLLASKANQAAGLIVKSFSAGGKVLICGNGGSAADSQHFAAELVGRFGSERAALPAIALTTNASILTAIGNDFGFEQIFSRQVEALGRPGDVLIAITTSGRSANIIRALASARKKNLKTIALIGNVANAQPELMSAVDCLIQLTLTSTPRIQETHIQLLHSICQLIDHHYQSPIDIHARPNYQLSPINMHNLDQAAEYVSRQGGKIIIEHQQKEYVLMPIEDYAAHPKIVRPEEISQALPLSPAASVKIGPKQLGDSQPTFIVAEIGINHNGDVSLAKRLIDSAVSAGADAVKFQKRTIDVVYTPEELAKPRENPFGPTNGHLKRGLELGLEQYKEIDEYCQAKGIIWFASPWDEASVDFLAEFNPPCYKISSPSLTDDQLLEYVRTKHKPVILSTGMSTMEEIEHAVDVLGRHDLILLHCTSTYPAKNEELNLHMIQRLKNKFPDLPIGYSGHEVGIATTIMSVIHGACYIERHITLDRAMWGTDQAASIEPYGFQRLVRDIRLWQIAKGDGIKKVYDSEQPIKEKLRRK